MKESIYSDTNSSGTLTTESIHEAVKMLAEYSKQPFITGIFSKYEWWNLIQKDNTSRNFSLYGGIPCYQDDSIPPNIARFRMSDGTYKDFEISSKPHYLMVNPHIYSESPAQKIKVREIWEKEGHEEIVIMCTVWDPRDETSLFKQRMMLVNNGWHKKTA